MYIPPELPRLGVRTKEIFDVTVTELALCSMLREKYFFSYYMIY